jgi:hypothetical protein
MAAAVLVAGPAAPRRIARLAAAVWVAAVLSGAMNDIVKENRRRLADLLAGRENWHPEEAGEDGTPGWCFGVQGAGRLTIVPEMDGFLIQIEEQKKTWVVPRIESVKEWLDANEAEYSGPTALQLEFGEVLERAREQRGGDQAGS